MLNENAERKIHEYVEVSIQNGQFMLDMFHMHGDIKHLELAILEESHAGCYWNVYHATTTHDSFDDYLWNSLCSFRERLKNSRPHGA
jgi:hypothetical protein